MAATLRALRRTRTVRDETPVLGAPDDPVGDRMQRRLLAAYALLDGAIADGRDLLAAGHSLMLLRLNHTVLYGPRGRCHPSNARAVAASERRFYEGEAFAGPAGMERGVADVIAWRAVHRRLPAVQRAAGVYVRTLAAPQLFVEGNHRSAMLLASHELLREGHPPFVLSVDNVAELRGCSAALGRIRRGTVFSWPLSRRLRRRIAAIILASADRAHLVPGAT